jgi:hypothetical protein
MRWLNLGFQSGAPSCDAAGRLHFQNAGLPCPQLHAEIPVAGGIDSPFYTWLAWVVRSLMPRLLQDGLVTEQEVEIETLEERLRFGAVEARAQVEAPPNILAWVTV